MLIICIWGWGIHYCDVDVFDVDRLAEAGLAGGAATVAAVRLCGCAAGVCSWILNNQITAPQQPRMRQTSWRYFSLTYWKKRKKKKKYTYADTDTVIQVYKHPGGWAPGLYNHNGPSPVPRPPSRLSAQLKKTVPSYLRYVRTYIHTHIRFFS